MYNFGKENSVCVAYIKVIQNMYDEVLNKVRTPDVLTESIIEDMPMCILFADDIVLLAELREEINVKLDIWIAIPQIDNL